MPSEVARNAKRSCALQQQGTSCELGFKLHRFKNKFSKRKNWLGWKDSNLRMPVPKTGALPLGYTPRPWERCITMSFEMRKPCRGSCPCPRPGFSPGGFTRRFRTGLARPGTSRGRGPSWRVAHQSPGVRTGLERPGRPGDSTAPGPAERCVERQRKPAHAGCPGSRVTSRTRLPVGLSPCGISRFSKKIGVPEQSPCGNRSALLNDAPRSAGPPRCSRWILHQDPNNTSECSAAW